MLGQDLVGEGVAAGHELTALTRGDLDVTDAESARRAIVSAAPDVVINCAAWTDVDGAESSADAALAVNGTGAGNVAAAAADAGAWVVQISTDYVFDGSKPDPYVESDPVGPISQYGISKLAGERAVAERAPDRHTIVRSSWLFGVGGSCFPATIMRLAGERDELTVVDDQRGCPTFTGHLASGLLALAQQPVPGILHVAGGGDCTWFEFATEIVESAKLECEVLPGSSEDLARPAPRPANSVLVTQRGDDAPRLPEWRDGLADYITAKVGAA
jgi:dTDP-4-dehydrorhamnose reductase